jgi:protein gp37
MSDRSNIEWTDASWNPIRCRNIKTGAVGHYCQMVSPGCANCYASTMQKRFRMPKFKGEREIDGDLEVFLDEEVLRKPLSWRKPRKVFVCSMSDLFGSWVPDGWIDAVFAVMALAKQHTFQVLTKRAERMRWYMAPGAGGCGPTGHIVQMAGEKAAQDFYGGPWPLPNVWLGVSVEDQQRADERIPWLLKTPAAVRFLSCEPLLGPIDLPLCFHSSDDPNQTDHSQCAPIPDWVICGGESGPGARPCHVEWISSIVGQCQSAGVACFVKQLGSKPASGGWANDWPKMKDAKGGDQAEWPESLRVREYPKVVTA